MLPLTSRHLPEDPQSGYLRLEKLCKAYPEGASQRTVLTDASLQAKQGEFTAILGRSGSGKTTLLNLISGIDRVDCGEIWLGSRRLNDLDDEARTLFRRREVGFIFQFFNTIPTLTVWENVLLPLELNSLTDPASLDYAASLLEEVGLAGRKNTYPDRLSGGEQQRVAVARALAHQPSLVLADEPTGNLDETTGRLVLEMLDRLTSQAGKNLILVTHSTEAAAYADQAYMLREGVLRPIEDTRLERD